MKARGLVRTLGSGEAAVRVLDGLDFDLSPGKTHAIVGPSGCGKSTLLYLMGLLDRPDRGEIYIGDLELAAASDEVRTRARNASLGFVFQFHFLLSEFSAMENVMLPMAKLGGKSREEMEQRAVGLLDKLGLADKARRMAHQLSGGEQQRVAIARALANAPAILLADEPTGNLDERNARQVFEQLQGVAHELGQAVLMVTHNPGLAEQCDRILRMRDGRFT
ncbi:MAG: ABC transporter ATP-binding protein [Opitutales bacterium]|nr:ABC transporter ATP-binding protein [Opitutales bacterium]